MRRVDTVRHGEYPAGRRASGSGGVFVGLCLGLLAPAGAFGAEIEGRVLNGSQPDGVVPGVEVRLSATRAGGEPLRQAVHSDADGRYRFTGLPADTADVFVLAIDFMGVTYASPLLRFGLGQPTLSQDLLVYEATTSVDEIALGAHHVFFETQPDAPTLRLWEIFSIRNDGSRTYTGEPIRFPLPHGATEIVGFEAFETAEAVGHEMRLPGPIYPGQHVGRIGYLLPARFPLEFDVRQILPTDEVSIVITPPGARVSGEGVRFLRTLDLGDGTMGDRYGVPIPSSGSSARVTIEPATSTEYAAWLIVGALLVLFIGVVLAREDRQRGRRGVPAEARRLELERDRYLKQIVDLERGGDGRGERAGSEAEREKLLARATALQAMIDDALEERR
jgi:hypothetical protein